MNWKTFDLGILGTGAVTPAGWLTQDFISCCLEERRLQWVEPARSHGVERGWKCRVHTVPGAAPAELLPKSPRLRRASPLTKFEVAASMQALAGAGLRAEEIASRLGIIHVLQNGCVQYSDRFFAELQVQPELPSPLIFPETVFNAPASHLAQCLGVNGMVTTLVGEPNHLVEAVFTARQWMDEGLVDYCLVIASEEMDWLTAEALSYYHPDLIGSEGAAALLFGPRVGGRPALAATVSPQAHHLPTERAAVIHELAAEARSKWPEGLLVDHLCGVDRVDHAESSAWRNWPQDRFSPRAITGDTLGASTALQWVLAAHLAASSQRPVVISMPGSTASSIAVMA